MLSHPWLDSRAWLDLIFLMISYVGRAWLKITYLTLLSDSKLHEIENLAAVRLIIIDLYGFAVRALVFRDGHHMHPSACRYPSPVSIPVSDGMEVIVNLDRHNTHKRPNANGFNCILFCVIGSNVRFCYDILTAWFINRIQHERLPFRGPYVGQLAKM